LPENIFIALDEQLISDRGNKLKEQASVKDWKIRANPNKPKSRRNGWREWLLRVHCLQAYLTMYRIQCMLFS